MRSCFYHPGGETPLPGGETLEAHYWPLFLVMHLVELSGDVQVLAVQLRLAAHPVRSTDWLKGFMESFLQHRHILRLDAAGGHVANRHSSVLSASWTRRGRGGGDRANTGGFPLAGSHYRWKLPFLAERQAWRSEDGIWRLGPEAGGETLGLDDWGESAKPSWTPGLPTTADCSDSHCQPSVTEIFHALLPLIPSQLSRPLSARLCDKQWAERPCLGEGLGWRIDLGPEFDWPIPCRPCLCPVTGLTRYLLLRCELVSATSLLFTFFLLGGISCYFVHKICGAEVWTTFCANPISKLHRPPVSFAH